jgi:ribosome biogenesis protein BRX1
MENKQNNSNQKLLGKKANRQNKKEKTDNNSTNKNNSKNSNNKNKIKKELSTFYKDEIEDEQNENNTIINTLVNVNDDEDQEITKINIDNTDINNDNKVNVVGSINNKSKWINRQRTLVVASRGISHQERYLVNDIISLLPHAKKEVKIEKNVAKDELTEICYNHGCQNALYFEHRKRELVLWMFRAPEGPCAKFQVRNVHTLTEIKLTGNCLKYSRPLLSFDKSFDNEPHLRLLKEMFTHSFNSPKNHPKTKPFYDHMLCFYNVNNHIFFKSYQIVNELKERFLDTDDIDKLQLVEIGPRFSLHLMRIFDGPLGGKSLYVNSKYIPPRLLMARDANKFKNRKKKELEEKEALQEKIMNRVENNHEWLDK